MAAALEPTPFSRWTQRPAQNALVRAGCSCGRAAVAAPPSPAGSASAQALPACWCTHSGFLVRTYGMGVPLLTPLAVQPVPDFGTGRACAPRPSRRGHPSVPQLHASEPDPPSALPALPCPGWPEYLAQTKQALARGYHVLALQSNSPSGCWSSSSSKPGFVDDRIDVRLRCGLLLSQH